MPLADPELELLQEILEDDPADGAFLDVSREFVRRGAWQDAIRILAAAAEAGADEPEGWSLMALAAFGADQFLRALSAVERFGPDRQYSDMLSRVRVLALEKSGQTDRARLAAEEHIQAFPEDDEVREALERLRRMTPRPATPRRVADPLLSADRAEGYVAVGRTDRAIRVYRRLLYHHPGNPQYELRLRELEGEDFTREDDLSEDLTADFEANRPPGLLMPSPGAMTPAPLSRGESPLVMPAPSPSVVPVMRRRVEELDVSIEEIAAAIEEHRRATGTPHMRSAVPDDAGSLSASEDILRAAEEIDVDELRDRIRLARERRARRRSLFRR